MNSLLEQVKKNRQEIKTDRMDMSFGEIMNMYDDAEIIITPEYQRSFRWTTQDQTKFIESILLGIPFPPIFVAEDDKNIWEVVDGLQRLSTVLSFFGKLTNQNKNNLVLTEGDILKDLNKITVDTIPTEYKLLIKRAVCRVEIIRIDSDFNMKYELFRRLNTGGIKLSNQEIRNCVFRSDSNTFNKFITRLSGKQDFIKIIKIGLKDKEKMLLEELVLRFFSLKNRKAKFGTNIQEHFDKYMKEIVNGAIEFNYTKEEENFDKTISILVKLAPDIFKMSRTNFSTSMFDSLMLCFAENLKYLENKDIDELNSTIQALKQNQEFKIHIGSGSSGHTKIKGKLKIAKQLFGIMD